MEWIETFQEQIQKDPILFLDGVLNCSHWSKQDEIIESVFNNQRTTVKSCFGIWKTFIAGRIALAFQFAYEDSIVITTAPTFRQVENILWREIRWAYKKSTSPLGWNMFKTKFEIDENWYMLWLSSDKEENFQWFHAKDQLNIADEAWGIQEKSLEALEALMTGKWTKLLYIWNPIIPNGGFYDSFKDESFNHISISVFDTPNFTSNGIKDTTDLKKFKTRKEVEDLPLVYEALVTPAWAWDKIERWGVDSPMYQSKVLAIFPDEWEDTLIKLTYLETSLKKQWDKQEWLERPRSRCIWIDVARFGSDTTVLIWMDNWKMDEEIVWHKWKDTMVTVWKAIAYFNKLWYKKEFEYFIVDDTWVGWGVTDRLRELGYNVIPVNNASSPNDTEIFRDIKAEIYWALRQGFIDWNIQIYDTLRLIKDISSIKYDYTSNWKIFIRSKKDMKKDWFDSPDYADALALAYYWCMVVDWWDFVIDGDDEKDEETIVWDIYKKSF